MIQKPTVGRIVHVFSRGHDYVGPYAAIVTRVLDGDEVIDCTLFTPWHAATRLTRIPFSDHDGNDGREMWWDWPERA